MSKFSYWTDKHDVGDGNDSNLIEALSEEILILIEKKHYNSVFEYACGNGNMYKSLGFDLKTKYKGIDISPHLLKQFKEKHKDVDIFEGDVLKYKDSNKYDLLIANGLLQYFNNKQIRSFLHNADTMMHENSRLICATIPWRNLKFGWETGEYRKGNNRRRSIGLYRWLRIFFFGDPMGRWFSIYEFKRLASEAGLEVNFFGSMTFLYRFNVVLTKKC
jgi:cyclopropane fatty-acyl-phospholipid synthase-like methyltransferase